MPTTFRPLLASGVRSAVVSDEHTSELKAAYENELAELDSSIELEGSCEHMVLESEAYNIDEDQINKNMYAERHRRVLKRWKEQHEKNSEDEDN